MHRLLRLRARIDDGHRLRRRNDYIANHRLHIWLHRAVHAFGDRLRARAHLRPLPQHVAPACRDVVGVLTVLRVEHDAAWFAADLCDALRQAWFRGDIDAVFRVGGDHAVIRDDDDQRAFG